MNHGLARRSTIVLASVLLWGLAGSACRKAAPPSPLVSEAELAELKTKADGMLAAARARRCPRPVLRGDATPCPVGKHA